MVQMSLEKPLLVKSVNCVLQTPLVGRILMVTLAVDGIDLFKIAGRSISGWVPSFKMSTAAPVKQPFCSQLEVPSQ
ncbi:hypothetical protein KSB_76550 [Ktedonobacter robiniae]|uniref:Uncharacterized protein n=1 Tax=Ktedonobacter robiniae TaxID=2778365 RepID=A0ABQ3V3G7_9CHLR|nr:hypothetical protein KSB_76550 [Ktedonobacter robiniae]